MTFNSNITSNHIQALVNSNGFELKSPTGTTVLSFGHQGFPTLVFNLLGEGVVKSGITGAITSAKIINSDINSGAQIEMSKLKPFANALRVLATNGTGYISESIIETTELLHLAGLSQNVQSKFSSLDNEISSIETAISNIKLNVINTGTFDFNSATYKNNGSWVIETTISNAPYSDTGNRWALTSRAIGSNGGIWQQAVNLNHADMPLVYERMTIASVSGPWILVSHYSDSIARAVGYVNSKIVYRKRITGNTGSVSTVTDVMSGVTGIYDLKGYWDRGGDKFFVDNAGSADVLSVFYLKGASNTLAIWFSNSAMANRAYDITIEYTTT